MPETMIWQIIFWVLVLLMAYTLKGYPVLLSIVSRLRREPDYPPASEEPAVSCIVAAYNEEKNISAKIANLLELHYPSDKIEFIIGSDASTDRTDVILTEAAECDSRIRYFRNDARGGKISILRKAVEMASGSILIFTDCSVRMDPDVMPVILSRMAHPGVGLVSSSDVWVNEADGTPVAQRQYIDYEMNIRKMESRLNSLVSASGSFFAVRKELYRTYGADQADDFALPLQVYRQGYRVIHAENMIGYVPMVKSSGAEVARRTRIILAGIRTVMANIALLNPFRYPVFAWQLWSHKVLKWLFPYFMLATMVLAFALWNISIVYKIIAGIYILICLLGLAGFVIRGNGLAYKPFRAANFFLLSMTAALLAWYKAITGAGRAQTWEPTHR